MFRFTSHWPKIIMHLNHVRFGKHMILKGHPYIIRSGKASIEIGDDVVIKSDPMSNLVGMTQRTYIIAQGNGTVKIGNRVGISGSSIYCKDRIEVGDDTQIGTGTKIMDTDSHAVDPVVRLSDPHNEKAAHAPVIIGKNVFIGCQSLILKGVTIGDNAVIGAGSVVCHDVPANCVAAGNPARVVKTL